MKNRFISYNEMKMEMIVGEYLRIELKDGKEVRINLRILKLEDIKILMN